MIAIVEWRKMGAYIALTRTIVCDNDYVAQLCCKLGKRLHFFVQTCAYVQSSRASKEMKVT